jgi:hypothetical protein
MYDIMYDFMYDFMNDFMSRVMRDSFARIYGESPSIVQIEQRVA